MNTKVNISVLRKNVVIVIPREFADKLETELDEMFEKAVEGKRASGNVAWPRYKEFFGKLHTALHHGEVNSGNV